MKRLIPALLALLFAWTAAPARDISGRVLLRDSCIVAGDFVMIYCKEYGTGTLSDEDGRYYTCILCQSFAPAHCCVVTPERLGLCGAVSWLDAKATNELNPNGPCQPIFKEGCLDERTGRYETVNKAVAEATHGAVENVTLYSILEDPMTSCGCFECICGIEPMSNGFIVVNREFKGMTPAGMTFGELASMTGGGLRQIFLTGV